MTREVLSELDGIFEDSKTEEEILKKLELMGKRSADSNEKDELQIIAAIIVRDPVGAMRAKARIAAFCRGYEKRVKKLLKDFFKN